MKAILHSIRPTSPDPLGNLRKRSVLMTDLQSHICQCLISLKPHGKSKSVIQPVWFYPCEGEVFGLSWLHAPSGSHQQHTGSRRWPGPYPTGVSIQWRCRKGEWGCSTWYRDGCTEVELLNPSQACTKQLLSTSLQITFPFFFKITSKIGKQKQPPVRLCPDAWQQLRSDVRWTLCWAKQWFLGEWGYAIPSPCSSST